MRKFKFWVSLMLIIYYAASIQAQDITFAKHVAPIVYNHCTTCHRTGEIAPFPLTNYNEVKAYGPFIKYVTSINYMPPWKPEKHLQAYLKENFLTDSEIETLGKWVDQGMVYGDAADEPELPVFPTGSQIGTPDLVVSYAQSHVHKGDGKDEYRYFVLPTNLTEDKYLVALEVRPGNKKIVHHTLVWADSTGAAKEADDATPEYGYDGSANSAASGLNNQLPGYVPGQKPIVYTEGLAMKVPRGSDLLLQMHYAPTFADEKDSTTVNLFFAKEPPTRQVLAYVLLPLPLIIGEAYLIPPNQVKTFHGQLTIPAPVTMLGLAPHMHLLGKKWEIYAVRPGNDTVRIMNINDWDFNWQGSYHLKKPIILPIGSVIHAIAQYDNTTSNPNNPNNPPKFITWGENTSDEMYYLPLIYMSYRAGDEDLEFEDETVLSTKNAVSLDDIFISDVYPNPTSQNISFSLDLPVAKKLTVQIFDASGNLVKTAYNNRLFNSGNHIETILTEGLQPGFYNLLIQSHNLKKSKKFILTN